MQSFGCLLRCVTRASHTGNLGDMIWWNLEMSLRRQGSFSNAFATWMHWMRLWTPQALGKAFPRSQCYMFMAKPQQVGTAVLSFEIEPRAGRSFWKSIWNTGDSGYGAFLSTRRSQVGIASAAFIGLWLNTGAVKSKVLTQPMVVSLGPPTWDVAVWFL